MSSTFNRNFKVPSPRHRNLIKNALDRSSDDTLRQMDSKHATREGQKLPPDLTRGRTGHFKAVPQDLKLSYLLHPFSCLLSGTCLNIGAEAEEMAETVSET